jgi:tetratricopeptide (TPR) repeat protein
VHGRPDSDRPRRLNPERFVELQRQQVADHLRFGEEAFARGEHDAALQHAERAATVDPNSRDAFDLIDRARFAIESKAIRQLLTQAQRLLADGHLDDAAALADEASVTFPDVQGAIELRDEVRQIVERITAAREREQQITSTLERARVSIERGGYETALRAIYEVLSLDPDRAEARALEQQAQTRLQAQREHERARRAAHEQIARARTLADEGNYEGALHALGAVASPSDTVRVAAAEAMAFVRAAQREAALAAIVAKARAAMDRGQFAEVLAVVDSIPVEEQSRDIRTLRETADRALREQRDLARKRAALETAIARRSRSDRTRRAWTGAGTIDVGLGDRPHRRAPARAGRSHQAPCQEGRRATSAAGARSPGRETCGGGASAAGHRRRIRRGRAARA